MVQFKKLLIFKAIRSFWSNEVNSLNLVWLFATPWTVAHQAPPSMGFSMQEYWSGLPFPSPGDLPDPGIEPRSPAFQADALTSEPPGKHWNSRRGGDCTTVGWGSLAVSCSLLRAPADSEHGVELRCSSSWKILLVEIKQKIFGYSILNSVFGSS